ncbi:hypothetical protein SO802_006096, partial [Lithocarpus litseifolius]
SYPTTQSHRLKRKTYVQIPFNIFHSNSCLRKTKTSIESPLPIKNAFDWVPIHSLTFPPQIRSVICFKLLQLQLGPSHKFAHGDTSQSPSMVHDDTCPPPSSTTSPLPTTYTSPPWTTGNALVDVHGRDEMRFMPTPGRPTPGAVPHEFAHIEFIQIEIPSPPPEASHIQEIQGEQIERVKDRPRRLQRTQTHPPDYRTGDGFNVETVEYKYISFTVWDVGGQDKVPNEVEQISFMKPKAQGPHHEGFLEYLVDIIGTNKYVEKIDEVYKQ